jgi:hypothetical protein
MCPYYSCGSGSRNWHKCGSGTLRQSSCDVKLHIGSLLFGICAHVSDSCHALAGLGWTVRGIRVNTSQLFFTNNFISEFTCVFPYTSWKFCRFILKNKNLPRGKTDIPTRHRGMMYEKHQVRPKSRDFYLLDWTPATMWWESGAWLSFLKGPFLSWNTMIRGHWELKTKRQYYVLGMPNTHRLLSKDLLLTKS